MTDRAERRRRKAFAVKGWTPFMIADNITSPRRDLDTEQNRVDCVVVNSRYQVTIYHPETVSEHWPEMRCLSIKARDDRTQRDWRDLQRIKNELLGKECEAVELFPAEGRLVDTADQWWLWGLVDAGRFPFGWHSGRLVAEVDRLMGGSQRRFEVRPLDCKNADDMNEIIDDAERMADLQKEVSRLKVDKRQLLAALRECEDCAHVEDCETIVTVASNAVTQAEKP